MKILLLTQFFSTTRGGGEYLFSLLAKQFGENGHSVWVITNKISDESYEKQKNVNLIFVPPTLVYQGGLPPSFLDNIRYSINAIRKGKNLIKHENIDIIHSNNFAPAFAGSVLSSLTSKPHVTSIWDIFTLCGKDYWSKWAKQNKVSKFNSFLGPRFEKFVLKLNHKAIHTISEASKNDLIKFGAKKPIKIVYPAIEQSFEKNLDHNHFQLICISRLVFYKNLDVVIKAINIVKQQIPKIKLIIIGSGPNENVLKKFASSLKLETNIEFKGYVGVEEKMKLIKESAAMVFPSICEGFGLVILEAFSQSKPVLVSNVKPMSDIINHNETGYTINPSDEMEWAKYIQKVIENPEQTDIMGKNGYDLLKSKYDPKKMSNEILELYSDILSK